jgi:hypothetical protein
VDPNLDQDQSNGDWRQWSIYVLKELKRLDSEIVTLRKEVDEKVERLRAKNSQYDIDLALIKSRSSMWGGLTAGAVAALAWVFQHFGDIASFIQKLFKVLEGFR